MERQYSIAHSFNIVRQRNFFVVMTCLLVISNFLISVFVITNNATTILVPGINNEMSISNRSISKSYLEEVSLMFLDMLLDLSKEDIETKRDLVLKYTKDSYLKDMQRYYQKVSKNYLEYHLSTYFVPKSLDLDTKNLVVIAKGIVTSRYGNNGVNHAKASYRLKFEYVGHYLRLKEFVKIEDE